MIRGPPLPLEGDVVASLQCVPIQVTQASLTTALPTIASIALARALSAMAFLQ